MSDRSVYRSVSEKQIDRPSVAEESEAFEEGESSELGTITIHHGVIAVIARLSALKVPGVIEMSGTFTDGIAGLIGKSSSDRGIRVEVDSDGVSIDLNIIVEYGIKIPPVAWQVQSDVRQAVEAMTGKRIKAVNVIIQGLRPPDSGAKQGEEA